MFLLSPPIRLKIPSAIDNLREIFILRDFPSQWDYYCSR